MSLRQSFRERLNYYRTQHRTVGCRLTHMIGIPLIAVSVLCLPFNLKRAVKYQGLGWILQFIGHHYFEHNKPVLMEMKDPLTAVAALRFVYDQWKDFFQGHFQR